MEIIVKLGTVYEFEIQDNAHYFECTSIDLNFVYKHIFFRFMFRSQNTNISIMSSENHESNATLYGAHILNWNDAE